MFVTLSFFLFFVDVFREEKNTCLDSLAKNPVSKMDPTITPHPYYQSSSSVKVQVTVAECSSTGASLLNPG